MSVCVTLLRESHTKTPLSQKRRGSGEVEGDEGVERGERVGSCPWLFLLVRRFAGDYTVLEKKHDVSYLCSHANFWLYFFVGFVM